MTDHTREQGLVDAVRLINVAADEDLAEGNWDAVNQENMEFLITECQWFLTIIGAMEWTDDPEVDAVYQHLIRLIDIFVYNIVYRESYGS